MAVSKKRRIHSDENGADATHDASGNGSSPSRPKKTPKSAQNAAASAASAAVPPMAVPAAASTPTPVDLAHDYDRIMDGMQREYSFVRALLSEFWPELQKDPRDTAHLLVENDASWFWFVEMKFLIGFLYEMAFVEFSVSVTKPDSITTEAGSGSRHVKETLSHRDNMQARVAFLGLLKRYVGELAQQRLAATQAAGKLLPRVFRLAKMYTLTPQETELFQLLVVLQGCQSSAVRCQMIEVPRRPARPRQGRHAARGRRELLHGAQLVQHLRARAAGPPLVEQPSAEAQPDGARGFAEGRRL